MEVITVNYHQHHVGALSFDTDSGLGAFEYAPRFIHTGIQLAPIKMPLAERIYSFPELDFTTFKGLPGLIADSLPDDFGNAVLNAWLASQGRSPSEIRPLQRLQFTGRRGMGALEYAPATRMKHLNAIQPVAIDTLVSIAQEILDARGQFRQALNNTGQDERQAMLALLSVGMSAGGARPKAVVAFNKDFITQRFDRIGNRKIHIQSLNGLMHIDYKKPGSFSYAELFGVARQLGLPATAAEQLMRRLVFNIVARNHDDHAKNFAFMLVGGQWSLAPAYDLPYSYKPGSKWVNNHWMSF